MDTEEHVELEKWKEAVRQEVPEVLLPAEDLLTPGWLQDHLQATHSIIRKMHARIAELELDLDREEFDHRAETAFGMGGRLTPEEKVGRRTGTVFKDFWDENPEIQSQEAAPDTSPPAPPPTHGVGP